MPHQLEFIKYNNIVTAMKQIDKEGVPKDHEWSEYWVAYQGKSYQFKYLVEIASLFTNNPIVTRDFTSNHSSRKYIASLGFRIYFKQYKDKDTQINYWIGASYYGLPGNQIDMFDDFIKKNYWRTDHDLELDEGVKLYNDLLGIRINDRIGIRYIDKKGSKIHIASTGTIVNITNIKDGRLGVIWDYMPKEYRGLKPSGLGSGNWWRTLFQLKRYADIEMIFGYPVIEKRIARLTWNEYGWVMPSGPLGKSEYKDSHESIYGYGHEEWLCDTGKIINGFHYGFLEPIRKQQKAFVNKVYDVWLYSVNGETKKRFWVGEIKNLTVIDKEEADKVKQIYIDKGWLEEMEEQIRISGAVGKGFSNWQSMDFFNVKFKPIDLIFNDPYYEIPPTHLINQQPRYSFIRFSDEYKIINSQSEEDFKFPFGEGKDEEDDIELVTKVHLREPRSVEIVYLHKTISKSLKKLLQKTYGKDNVIRECPAGYGANKIDIVVNDRNDLVFYEIKTYTSVKTSIREAIGQLFEYCFYPDLKKAKKLVIVTQLPADVETRKYFKHLRDALRLSIYYQSYDLELKSLSEMC